MQGHRRIWEPPTPLVIQPKPRWRNELMAFATGSLTALLILIVTAV